MSTYVMSDIHGCYEELMAMMEQIGLQPSDRLIVAGDYIDRGAQNFEMLQWIMDPPENVILLKGNHDDRFVTYVGMLAEEVRRQDGNPADQGDTLRVHESLVASGVKPAGSGVPYDFYGTIGELIREKGVALSQLLVWTARIRELPLVHREEMGDRHLVVVHGGYLESLEGVDTKDHFESLDMFYLWARNDGYRVGGLEHGLVISGHTPTFFEEFVTYNDGKVFRMYDEEKDCVFFDIDCGYVYRNTEPRGKMACLRLEDEAVFYLKEE